MATSRFSTKLQRSMAVIVLADVSGSMAERLGGNDTERKIDALNLSVVDLIAGCAEPNPNAIISISVITFGNGTAESVLPLTVVKQAKALWQNVEANGDTPLGKALMVAKRMIEEKNVIRAGSYRPVLVLATDGMPTDDWGEPLKELNEWLRSRQADRFAIGIGLKSREAEQVLEEFVKPSVTEGEEGKGVASRIFSAASAQDIHQFFQYVTLHSVRRASQIDPSPGSEGDDDDPEGY